MNYEIRWKRRLSTERDEFIADAWTLHRPLPRSEDEAGTVVAELLKKHRPLVVTIVEEKFLESGTKSQNPPPD